MIKETNGSRGRGIRLVKVKGENDSYASLFSFPFRMMSMIVKPAQKNKKEKTSSQHLAIIGSRLLVLT